MAEPAAWAGEGGLTLVELMIVSVIVSLTMVLAAPTFSRLLESTRIRIEATRLMSDVVLTRSEAIKRNRQVVMCPLSSTVHGVLTCGGGLASGWVIFVDGDRDGELDMAEQVLATGRAISTGLGITNRLANRDAEGSIVFLADGSSRRNRTLMICSSAYPGIESWSVVMNLIGRPRLARGWGECS